jgi:hypothetical protein
MFLENADDEKVAVNRVGRFAARGPVRTHRDGGYLSVGQ